MNNKIICECPTAMNLNISKTQMDKDCNDWLEKIKQKLRKNKPYPCEGIYSSLKSKFSKTDAKTIGDYIVVNLVSQPDSLFKFNLKNKEGYIQKKTANELTDLNDMYNYLATRKLKSNSTSSIQKSHSINLQVNHVQDNFQTEQSSTMNTYEPQTLESNTMTETDDFQQELITLNHLIPDDKVSRLAKDNDIVEEGGTETDFGKCDRYEETDWDDSKLRQIFIGTSATVVSKSGYALADRNYAEENFVEYSLLGVEACVDDATNSLSQEREVYLNTHEPFCIATIGVQGGGKSHTLSCLLESCLVPFPEAGIVRLTNPMSTLVLHYDQCATSICEAIGLAETSPLLSEMKFLRDKCVPKDKIIVLVSPSYYKQRKAFYGDRFIVKPLLFEWKRLNADHIKKLMRLTESDNQLYVAVFLDFLRRAQRNGNIPSFDKFQKEISTMFPNKIQNAPLIQRMSLLESFVSESSLNEKISKEGSDVIRSCGPGNLVIVDLTDPLLATEEANSIFQVVTEQYRVLPNLSATGKFLVLDEAHKFMNGVSTDGLSESIVNIARLMRHDGIRLAVSTQSPMALAQELLELVTVAILHKFHSQEWFQYLSRKIPLSPESRESIMKLETGQAVVFSSKHKLSFLSSEAVLGMNVFLMTVRQRITADRGNTKKNVVQGSSS